MRDGIEIEVSAADRARLEAVVADRNSPQKHVWRARIILATADGLGTGEVMRRAGVSKPCVWRWQERFMREGVAGLLRDKSRRPGKAPLGEATVRRVVALTCAEPPGEATHWTGRAMAAAAGSRLRSVQRIWAAHKLQPHRVRTFKRSRDPAFLAKLEAIVGLYVAPPRHAVVLSVDEKPQIQALDRTQPGLPAQARPVRDDDPRLRAPRHHDPVRGPERARRARCSAAACSATATRSSCASSTRSRRRCRPAG
jgi:transposase